MTTPIEVPADDERSPFANWRTWLIVGCLGIGFALIIWLRTTTFTGVVIDEAGERLVIRPSPWWMAAMAVPAAVFLALGAAGITARLWYAKAVGAVAVVAGMWVLVIMPTVLTGELVVTPDGFSHTAGFWWQPETKQVRFAEIESIDVRPLEVSRRYSTWSLECTSKDGQVVSIPKSTVLEAGLKSVLDRAEEQGIVVHLSAAIEEGGT